MKGVALAETLIERGLDPTELEAKRQLFDRVLGGFSALSRRFPQHVWWVPGRLEVFGKHTDYAGGRTLVCALPRGVAAAASPRDDNIIRVADARSGESVILDSSAQDSTHTGWRHYVEVVARRLARNFPASALGMDMMFGSDLPAAAGMSSSSVLMVSVATAIGRVAQLDGRPEWQANIRDSLDAAGYYACIENGLTFGTLAGDAGVGTHGGSEDHAAILAGEAGHLTAFSFVPMRRLGSARMPDDWRFAVAPSGVAAEKTGAARDAYNRLSRGAQILLDLWNRVEPPAASLRAALESSAAAHDRFGELTRRSSIKGWPPDALQKRLDHFVREDARVLSAAEAFSARNQAWLTSLAADSQADADTLLENQVPETIALARTARRHGAFAACSFGAGFGGSVWALVDRDVANAFAGRWHRDAFVAAPAPPLTEL